MTRRFLWLDGDDAETDVVVPAFGLEAETESGAAGPAFVGPATATSDARRAAVAAVSGGVLRRVQIGVSAAGQAVVIPIAAPFEFVTMHVVQAPCVGRIAADRRGALERWTFFGAVVGLALEIRLTAAQLVAKGGCGGGACAAGIFPLRFGRQPELPIARELARGVSQICKFLQKPSASAKLIVYTGKLSPSPAVNGPGKTPTTRRHCDWVTSCLPIQNPLESLTWT